MRKLSHLTLIIILFGLSLQVSAQDDTEVTLFLPYIPSVQFAPIYVAMENGYFVEEGIDIELEYNFNEVDGVDRIAVNDLQFGIISGEQVIIGRGAEKPLVYVYEWYHDFPVGIAAPADSGIETPEDLLDQKIGIPGPYGASYIGFRAILAAGGLDDLDVEAESIGFTAPESLCENRVDAATVYINNEPLIVENNCFPVTVLAVSDYVELVSNGLVTNEETIENNPELVAGMARALQRGILDTIADPDAAFDMSLPYMPDLAEENYELERAVLENTLLLWESDNPGATTPERWENMQTVLLDIGFINTPLEDLSAAYTLDFIPQTEE